MNPSLQARQAYAPGHGSLRSARSAELHVFGEVTARLHAAREASFPMIVSALHANRQLWNRLAADVADSGNGLPAPLRAQIFYLAEFTEHHSRRVLRGEADLDALIDINAAVMRGLGGTASERTAS